MLKTIEGSEYIITSAHVDDIDLSLMSTDMPSFQKSVFEASVKCDDSAVMNPTLKVYLGLMPFVMEVNGFGDEVGNVD